MRKQFGVVLLVSCVLAACGGSGGGASPAAPSPAVRAITVSSSSDLLTIGTSEVFTASAAMSNGSASPVTGGAWGGDAPAVATVESSTGKVTIVGSGNVTVFVDYHGVRGTKLVRGLPGYQGAWSGSYYVTGCSQTGDFKTIDVCSGFPVNHVFPTNLTLTQNRDGVQGRVFLGSLGADATGLIQTDGRLLITAAVQESGTTIETSWTLQSTTPGRITGTLSQQWRHSGMSGEMRVNTRIRDLNRTSSVMAARAVPHYPRASLHDLVRALAAGGR